MKRLVMFVIGVLGLLTFSSKSFSQQWSVVPSPNPSSDRNILNGVGFISANDGWAVGTYDQSQPTKTLTLHWNGINWTQIPSPSPSTQYNELNAVYGFASDNVYAVGSATVIPSTPQTLALHWNGSAWTQMNTPTIQGGSSMQCILAFAPNDIWAGGLRAVGSPGPTTGTLVTHWNGSTWDIIATPNQSNERHNEITDMKGSSPNDIWAVGYSRNFGENYQAMVLHKTGTDWNIIQVPNEPGNESFLYSIDIIASNDIWATGNYNDGSGYRPLFLHYNGSSWTIVSSPGGGYGTIHNSPNDIWSTGSNFVHYNGSIWNAVSAPIPSNGGMGSMSRLSSTDIWSVGNYDDGILKTLIMHYSNSTGIEPVNNLIPEEYSLLQNYPNPFNPATVINYSIPQSGNVTLTIYDALGKNVSTLVNEMQNAGNYQITWDAASFSSGVYFYHLESGDFTSSKTMFLVR